MEIDYEALATNPQPIIQGMHRPYRSALERRLSKPGAKRKNRQHAQQMAGSPTYQSKFYWAGCQISSLSRGISGPWQIAKRVFSRSCPTTTAPPTRPLKYGDRASWGFIRQMRKKRRNVNQASPYVSLGSATRRLDSASRGKPSMPPANCSRLAGSGTSRTARSRSGVRRARIVRCSSGDHDHGLGVDHIIGLLKRDAVESLVRLICVVANIELSLRHSRIANSLASAGARCPSDAGLGGIANKRLSALSRNSSVEHLLALGFVGHGRERASAEPA